MEPPIPPVHNVHVIRYRRGPWDFWIALQAARLDLVNEGHDVPPLADRQWQPKYLVPREHSDLCTAAMHEYPLRGTGHVVCWAEFRDVLDEHIARIPPQLRVQVKHEFQILV